MLNKMRPGHQRHYAAMNQPNTESNTGYECKNLLRVKTRNGGIARS